MEQSFKQAREAVRQHNGIKVLLSLLHPRTALSPPTADMVRALACHALLGLARDPAIAHILTKLQVIDSALLTIIQRGQQEQQGLR